MIDKNPYTISAFQKVFLFLQKFYLDLISMERKKLFVDLRRE